MKLIDVRYEFVCGLVFGFEFVPKRNIKNDEAYLMLELGIARVLFTFG